MVRIVIDGCHHLEALQNFDVRFGIKGLIDAGGNATQQFVGSYKVDIIPNTADDGMATFYVRNVTSMTSLLFDSELAKSWSREIFPPGGNQTQIYTWEERMCGQVQ